jgi:hypothetical protein
MKTIMCILLISGLIMILGGLGIAGTHWTASAQSGDGYTLTWNTAEGGGMSVSAGASYNLTGTFGQTDASSTQLSGDTYKLEGGFWLGAITNGIFLPVVTK